MNWKEELVQNIKDCGQSLIDNAEKIVSDCKYTRGLTITCYIDEREEPPYINVEATFYPENWIERH